MAKKSSTAVASSVAPVVELVAKPKTVKSNKSASATSAPKAKSAAASATSSAPAPVASANSSVAVASSDAVKSVPRAFSAIIDDCIKQSQEQVVSNRLMLATIREAAKAHEREVREAQKSSRKSRKSSTGVNKPLTGFAKPCIIADVLADFLIAAGETDIKRGAEMTRQEVTRRLNKYFIEKGLRDTEDKRTILYEKDPALVKLLGGGVKKDSPLSYFNLQHAIKDLFVKSASVAKSA